MILMQMNNTTHYGCDENRSLPAFLIGTYHKRIMECRAFEILVVIPY